MQDLPLHIEDFLCMLQNKKRNPKEYFINGILNVLQAAVDQHLAHPLAETS